MEEFLEKRRGGSTASATAVRVVFDSERKLHFVNPYYRKEVSELVKGAFRVKPKVDAQAFVFTWSLQKPSDLEAFDELHACLEEHLLLKLDERTRQLLPQGVRGFLGLHGCPEKDLDVYTLSFQHFPARMERSLDNHAFFAKQIFEAMAALAEAHPELERLRCPQHAEKLVRASRKLQETVNKRIGLFQEKEETPLLASAQPRQVTGEEGEEEPPELNEAPWASKAHPRHLVEEEKAKKKSIDRMLSGLFSQQCKIKNSFGNILTNSGDATVLGGGLPSIAIGHEKARSLGCWDFDLPLRSEGDLDNDELLGRLCRGPLRKGGAWTLHLCFNRAVALPARGFEGLPKARDWLEKELLKEALAYFEEQYLCCHEKKPDSVEALKLLLTKALRARRLLRDLLEEEDAATGVCGWLLEHSELLPETVQWVTAVQRHARTGDLVTVVRHPITQPVPRFLLMVDETLSGWSIRYPPQFVDFIGADYDGDKVELAIQRSRRKQEIFKRRLTIPSLCFNALGKQVARLTGTAPEALQLMQCNGRSQPDVYGLEKGGRGSRVLWPGVLETTYSPSVFFEALAAMGTALPKLLEQWSTPLFEERRFEVRLPDGSTLTSSELGVSHDGFYPVELEATSCQKEAWLRAELLTQLDALPRLRGSRDFSVRLSDEAARPSALDNLTFSQMLSLVFAFVPSNFERTDGRVQVVSAPQLVEKGIVKAYDGSVCSPWERLARALLRLGSRPVVLKGLEAAALQLRRCAWRPSFDELAQRLLERKDPALYKVLGLPQTLRDEQKLRSLAFSGRKSLEEGGYSRELRLLDRYFFRFEAPDARSLNCIRALWEASVPHESWSPKLLPWTKEDLPGPLVSEWASAAAAAACEEESSEEEGRSLVEGSAFWRLEKVKTELRGLLNKGLRLEVEKGPPPTDADFRALETSLSRVVTVRQVRRLCPVETAATEPERRRPLLDWLRFVACVRPPRRIDTDVQEILNVASPLCKDRRDYCMVLTNLEALGQKMGTFLNQPKQKQIILEEDLHMRLANFGLQEARKERDV